MTEKVSAKPMNCSNTAEISSTSEALNLMAAEETNVGEMVQMVAREALTGGKDGSR